MYVSRIPVTANRICFDCGSLMISETPPTKAIAVNTSLAKSKKNFPSVSWLNFSFAFISLHSLLLFCKVAHVFYVCRQN